MRTVTTTDSAEGTMALGERLGRLLKPGDVVALFGDLGAGKTVLTKGIALGLGLEADVHSPTFALIHEHPGQVSLYHVDLYRLAGEAEVESIGVVEYLARDGVTVIEWADRMRAMLPKERLDITLRRIRGQRPLLQGDTRRELAFDSESPRFAAVVEELTRDADACD